MGRVIRVEGGVGMERMWKMVGEKDVKMREGYGRVREKKVFEEMEKLMGGREKEFIVGL